MLPDEQTSPEQIAALRALSGAQRCGWRNGFIGRREKLKWPVCGINILTGWNSVSPTSCAGFSARRKPDKNPFQPL
jgi:hypothetical protein